MSSKRLFFLLSFVCRVVLTGQSCYVGSKQKEEWETNGMEVIRPCVTNAFFFLAFSLLRMRTDAAAIQS